MDTEETWAKCQYDKDPHHKADKTEISWFWILQRQQVERMEVQTTPGICEEVQRQTERTDL